MPKIEGLKEIRDAVKPLERAEKRITRIARRAANSTARRGRTVLRRRIQQQVNLKARDINKEITTQTARGGSTTAIIRVSAKDKQLSNFGARDTKKGVTVRVKAGGSRKLIRGAFMPRLKSGAELGQKRAVAVRTGGKFPRSRNAAFRVLYGPSVYQVFRKSRRAFRKVLDRILERETARLIRVEQEKLF